MPVLHINNLFTRKQLVNAFAVDFGKTAEVAGNSSKQLTRIL